MIEIILLIVIISLWCNGLFLITGKDNDLTFSFIGIWYDKLLLKRRDKFSKKVFNIAYNPHTPEYTEAMERHENKKHNYIHRYTWITNPLFSCITCMSSFWTFVWYSILRTYTLDSYYEIPLIILSCAFLNTLLFHIYERNR